MPTLDATNIPVPRTAAEIKTALINALVARFGHGPTNPSNPIHQLADAFMLLPVDRLEQELLALYSEFDPRSNHGVNLESSLWPLFDRLQAQLAAGYVELSYKAPLPTGPTPLFAASSIDFIDSAGLHYRLNAPVNPPAAVFDGGTTGTASETIGGIITEIAQRVRNLADQQFVQAVRFKPTTVGGSPVVNVRIETDSAGSPSGVLADPRLVITGFAIASGAVNEAVFAKGARLPTAVYWAVIVPTSGTLNFDGGAGGALTGQVKIYSGGFSASARNNLNIQVVAGGVAPVAAVALGSVGNIPVGNIVAARFANTPAQTLYGQIVASQENLLPFAGGQDTEADAELRLRAQTAKTARLIPSLDGIVTALADDTPGVTSADGIENVLPTLVWGTQDTFLNNQADTGAASETVGATNTRYAQSFTLAQAGSASQVYYKLNTNSSLVFDLRIETDASGSPSGVLASANLAKVGVTPTGTTRTQVIFASGDILPAGTYWVVASRTGGSGTFDGITTGAQGAKYYNGAWANSSNHQAAFEVYGGLPPRSYRVYALGGTTQDIVDTIQKRRPPGIYMDGPISGTSLDRFGRPVTVRYAIPVALPVVIYVTANVDKTFLGNADTLRDLLVEYIGGVDTKSVSRPGLGISKALTYDNMLAKLTPIGSAAAQGVFVQTVRVGVKSSFANPAALGSGQVVDIASMLGGYYTISNAAVDVAVTLTQV